MANIHPETGRLCLHVVYDGAPYSGKTTSLLSLARLFGRRVVTPEERQGRTIYFDWLDYEGGRYDGRPIQCRLIAVPGQDALAARRATILQAADAVVFVADVTSIAFERTRLHLADLRRRLRERSRDIPIIVQLNKQDATDVIDHAALAAWLGPYVQTVRTVAPTGAGIREAFVLAVGEAVRAIRGPEHIGVRAMPRIAPDDRQLGDPDELLNLLANA